MRNKVFWIYVLISLAGIIWSALFIYQSSYIAIDGHRYYGLFDDAMISMRYAWNFAHGYGLIWNPGSGQRVEGYTNLLMVLLMAVASLFLNKAWAVLAVQIFGVFTMLATAWLTKLVSDEINAGQPYQGIAGILALAGVLAYFPLNYWALMGMETGLVALLIMAALLFALRWLKTDRDAHLTAAAIAAGLAFLARNDSLILSALIFVFVLIESYLRERDRRVPLKILYAGALFLMFPLGQTVFRYFYYGAVLPNTYTLKLVNFPLSIRVRGGVLFTFTFLKQTAPILILAALGLAIRFNRVKLLLFGLMAASIAYQIYVGGDPWPRWRMLSPAMPALFLLAILGCTELASHWSWLANRKSLAYSFLFLLSFGSLAFADGPFLDDMSVRAPTSAAIANRVNTNTALTIDHLTSPQATIGVIWAGTLPYYANRYTIDFLGKSDPYIAQLNADVSGAVSWEGMISVPGHNKYDLDYSIVQLQPTYIQAYSWGDQTVKPWVTQHYDRVEYHGPQGIRTVFLWRNSPYVCWEACQSEYKIIPWPKQKQDNNEP